MTGWLPERNGLRLFPSWRCITAMPEPDAPGPVLTGKTKAASFRLSTTVGRLCFGHYDIFGKSVFSGYAGGPF